MSWLMPCPACDHPIRPRPGSDGQWARCPSCQHRLLVPARSMQTPVPAPPPEAAPVMPPTPAQSYYPPAGFWRGLVVGVGVVALATVVALGVRGLWPAPGDRFPGDQLRVPGGAMRGPGGPFLPALPGLARETARTDTLAYPDGIDLRVPLTGGQKLATAGTLPPFIAFAAAPKAGLLLAAADDGQLLLHDAADLAPRGRVLLDGPACFLELDEERGRLYAAVARSPRVRGGRLGERDVPACDLFAYDVKSLLAAPAAAPTRLAPAGRLELDAPVAALLLAPDGRRLYLLTDPAHGRALMRVEASTLTADRKTLYPDGSGAGLALAPDGSALYTLIGGRLASLDPESWNETGYVHVGPSPISPVALHGGRVVLLLDRQPALRLVFVDVPSRKALSRWELPVDGRPYLARSADGKQIYLGTAAVLHGAVWQFDCHGDAVTRPAVVRSAASDRHRLFRGPLYVSPDARHLIFGNGVVLTPGA
ncbi:MAG: hypothetical protein ACRC33_10805 [Gemmataceae bacterium]